MTVSVCVAGATGWTGRAVAEAVLGADDLQLRSAVGRAHAGSDLGVAWGGPANGVPVDAAVADALDGVDVLVDYTSHDAVLGHVLSAVERGVHVVVGTSGLTAEEFARIDAAARAAGVGRGGGRQLLPHRGDGECGGAAGGAVPAAAGDRRLRVRGQARRPQWHSAGAGRAARRREPPTLQVALDATSGPVQARGATVAGTQVHSVRLPSFVVSTEVVFAAPDERLVIRHDAGPTPTPYVAGTLLAVRRVSGLVGLVRGLDRLLLGAAAT